MNEFNIYDYIWYIVGGVALFFVIVGFIADKSGLAKKTFSKDSKKSKDDIVQPQQVSYAEAVPEAEPMVEVPPVGDTQQNIVEEQLNYQDNNVDVVNNEVLTDDTVLYISDEQQSANEDFIDVVQDTDTNDVQNAESMEQNLSTDEISTVEESNIFEDNVENEVVIDSDADNENNISDDSSFTLDSVEPVATDIASDNVEDEWGMNSASETDIISSIDTELPSLDDLAENSEDDVWKF